MLRRALSVRLIVILVVLAAIAVLVADSPWGPS